MRYIIFFLLVGFMSIGQTKTSGVIEYVLTKNLGVNYKTKAILEFNNYESVFVELSPNYQSKVTTIEENDKITAYSYSKKKPMVYINLKKDSLIENISLFRKEYRTIEKIPEIEWEIKEDFKVFNNIKCQLAIGKFRGRIYSAWFTTDIPLKYGPWKIQGLPGLILEVNDDKNQLSFIASRVKIGLKTSIDSVKSQLLNSKIIALKDFIEQKKDIYKKKEELMASKVPRNGSFKLNMPNRNTQKEIIYEWEEKTKN